MQPETLKRLAPSPWSLLSFKALQKESVGGVHEPCAPHLSWGTLLHRSDDRNPVSLFQGEAVASVAGPYLGRRTGLVTDGAEAATDRRRGDITQTALFTKSDLEMTFSTIFRSCFMGLCLVLEPSISSSAKNRNNKGSSLNSLFSNTGRVKKQQSTKDVSCGFAFS